MTEPHKARGSFQESAESIEIVCGVVAHYPDLGEVCVENIDERGYGSERWFLKADPSETGPWAAAWIPFEEMPVPEWYKE